MARRPSAAARRGGADELVRVDTRELRDLIKKIKTVEDKKLKAALRKALRESAKPAVAAVRAKVLEPAPSEGKRKDVGRIYFSRTKVNRKTKEKTVTHHRMTTRKAIAQGVAASMRAGATTATVTVKASPRHLADRAGMLKAYNQETFRHPLFGDQDHWFEQSGNPYFGSVLYGQREAILTRLKTAMDDVTKKL